MMFVRVGTLVIAVLYYPAYTIRAVAYGQLAVSTILVVLYWLYFYTEFQKKRKLAINRSSHTDDPLLALPFDSLRNFMPQNVPGQVELLTFLILYIPHC